METFLIYIGKVAAITAVFYLFYRLMLSRDTWHRLNRIMLLATAILSFALPVCVITLQKTQVIDKPLSSVNTNVLPLTQDQGPAWWQTTLTVIYIIGVAVVLARTLLSILSVRRVIKEASVEVLPDGNKVYIMQGNGASFSWMGHIVISRQDWDCSNSAILRHEQAHVRLHHSTDVLIVDLITAAQWFNPAIWMLRTDLRAVHEYEADDNVLRDGTDLRSYQYLLISKAAAMSGYTIANNFNHSILKNRIFMMEKEKTTAGRAWKALWILPLVCICLAANAKQEVNYVYEDQAQKSADQQTVNWKVSATIKYNQEPTTGEASLQYKQSGEPTPEEVISNIQKLPGVEMDSAGNVTVNGRIVSRILYDGEEIEVK